MDTLTRRAALIMVGSDLAARVGDRTAADRDQVDVRVLRARRALGRLLDAELLEVPALARAQAAFGSRFTSCTKQRAAYVDRVTSLAKPGSKFLLWCFEWEVKRWERLASAIVPVTGIALQPGEVERWFGSGFVIKQVAGETGLKTWPRGWAGYLMTRR